MSDRYRSSVYLGAAVALAIVVVLASFTFNTASRGEPGFPAITVSNGSSEANLSWHTNPASTVQPFIGNIEASSHILLNATWTTSTLTISIRIYGNS
jgi:hypothetical protein